MWYERAPHSATPQRGLLTVKILIISPAPRGSTLGNSVTADRYARIFRSLGHKTTFARIYDDEPVDCVVALHARRSGPSALAFRARYPKRSLVVVLTGTDLYRDIRTSRIAQKTLDAATAIVTLQPDGLKFLRPDLRKNARVIIQSASAVRPIRKRKATSGERKRRRFEICVLGHLRVEKDPFRAAYALRYLPPSLRVRVSQAGRLLDVRYAQIARLLDTRYPGRYRWLGELSRAKARRLLASSDAMVISSRMEGGANVVCESIASGVPVLASDISGNVGILGRKYPGLYPLANTKALANLMERAATKVGFLELLKDRCAALKPLVTLAHERRAWAELLEAI
jgi:putative glycosyltransferase (TIGR04348 family)